MAALIPAIIYTMDNTAAITALVSTRSHHGLAPGSTTPTTEDYIAVFLVDEIHEHHQGGISGVAEARVQIDCIGRSLTLANAIYDKVRVTFDGYKGQMGASGSQVGVQAAWIVTDSEEFGMPSDGSQGPPFTRRLDLMVRYTESTT